MATRQTLTNELNEVGYTNLDQLSDTELENLFQTELKKAYAVLTNSTTH